MDPVTLEILFRRKLFPAVVTLALSGCVPAVTGQPPLVVNVNASGSECRVTVDRVRVTQKQLLEMAHASPKRHGIIIYANNVPYRCIGAAIITLQEAGVQSVDAAAWNGS